MTNIQEVSPTSCSLSESQLGALAPGCIFRFYGEKRAEQRFYVVVTGGFYAIKEDKFYTAKEGLREGDPIDLCTWAEIAKSMGRPYYYTEYFKEAVLNRIRRRQYAL